MLLLRIEATNPQEIKHTPRHHAFLCYYNFSEKQLFNSKCHCLSSIIPSKQRHPLPRHWIRTCTSWCLSNNKPIGVLNWICQLFPLDIQRNVDVESHFQSSQNLSSFSLWSTTLLMQSFKFVSIHEPLVTESLFSDLWMLRAPLQHAVCLCAIHTHLPIYFIVSTLPTIIYNTNRQLLCGSVQGTARRTTSPYILYGHSRCRSRHIIEAGVWGVTGSAGEGL